MKGIIAGETEKFFVELKESIREAGAYVEVPVSTQDWEREKDPALKTLTAFLFLLWKAGYPLDEVYHGWFFDSFEELKFILRIEDEDWVLFLKRTQDGTYRLLLNERLWVPKKVEEFAEDSELLERMKNLNNED